jgi:membrane protein
VAFYGLLAVFPAIAALISIWALAFDPLQIEQQIEGLTVAAGYGRDRQGAGT